MCCNLILKWLHYFQWEQWSFPKCFSLNSLSSVTKMYDIKRTRTCHPATSCVRNQHATTVPARHMWEIGSLNWIQFMLQWFISVSEFTEFSESSAQFRQISNITSISCSVVTADVDARCNLTLITIPRPLSLKVCSHRRLRYGPEKYRSTNIYTRNYLSHHMVQYGTHSWFIHRVTTAQELRTHNQ